MTQQFKKLKNNLTKQFLTELNLDVNKETIRWFDSVNWFRPGCSGLRLSDAGLECIRDTLGYKSYEIVFTEKISKSLTTLIFFDRYLDCPFHVKDRKLTVFSEYRAVEFMLFAYDIKEYGKTKAMNTHLNLRAY